VLLEGLPRTVQVRADRFRADLVANLEMLGDSGVTVAVQMPCHHVTSLPGASSAQWLVEDRGCGARKPIFRSVAGEDGLLDPA
jgi:hypothetical protein